jgi:leucyl aminopeptidase
MKIEITDKKLNQIKADCEIVFVLKNDLKHKWVKDRKDLEFFKFKAEPEQIVLLPHRKKVYLGIESLHHEELRTACALALKAVKGTKCSILKIGMYADNDPLKAAKAMTEGFILGSYQFSKYKSKKEKDEHINKIVISSEDHSGQRTDKLLLQAGLQQGEIVSGAVNYTRDLINHTPEDMTPDRMGQVAKELAKELKIDINVYDEKFLLKHGMNAFYAVSRGSAHKPRLIHLAYKPKNAKTRVAFVGKGLTYDSGGLSLKPSDAMVTMKSDKSGAGAVLGIIKAAAALQLPIEIHGIIGATENMIGATAYKNDDVLVAKNGKTIEVRNTDAEGRLVLADCLVYAQDFKPDYLVDLATLTGACIVALGEYTIGVMGYNSGLKNKIAAAGEETGELTAQLPFNKHLAKMIKSQVADIKNVTGSKYGGAITAALFLAEFIDEKFKDKWVHLDIAGPAYHEKEWAYNPHGASGAGIRLSVEFLQNI